MTDPHKKFLQPDLAKANASELIDVACPLIEELRNYATHLYVRCASAGNRRHGDLSVFFLFHHIIEMSDGIHVLLSEACCGPVVPVLRSLFEAFLSLAGIIPRFFKFQSFWTKNPISKGSRSPNLRRHASKNHPAT